MGVAIYKGTKLIQRKEKYYGEKIKKHVLD